MFYIDQLHLQMKGEAEAYAIEAKAKAESEQMTKKAEAWKEYQDAAKIEMILDVLPRVSQSIIWRTLHRLLLQLKALCDV